MSGLRGLGVAVVALGVLAASPAAEAATLSRDGNTIVFTDTAANFYNEVFVYKLTGSDEIFIGDENTPTLTDAGSGCQDLSDQYSCSNVTALRIVVGGGNDSVENFNGTGDEPADVPMTVDLGEGNDFLVAGPDDDVLFGGPGVDTLNADAGNDTLDGGFGSDYLDGGADGDLVTYAARTEPIGVDFTVPGIQPQPHGSSNDGPPLARDHIRAVETVVGGSGNDMMKAGVDPITFRGGAGQRHPDGQRRHRYVDRRRRRGHNRRARRDRHGPCGRWSGQRRGARRGPGHHRLRPRLGHGRRGHDRRGHLVRHGSAAPRSRGDRETRDHPVAGPVRPRLHVRGRPSRDDVAEPRRRGGAGRARHRALPHAARAALPAHPRPRASDGGEGPAAARVRGQAPPGRREAPAPRDEGGHGRRRQDAHDSQAPRALRHHALPAAGRDPPVRLLSARQAPRGYGVPMAIASDALVRDKLFIGGEWVEPAGDGTIEVVNPTTEEIIGRIPEGTAEDADRAVRAARAAFDSLVADAGRGARRVTAPRSRRSSPSATKTSPR